MRTNDVFWNDSVPNPYGKSYEPRARVGVPFFLGVFATTTLGIFTPAYALSEGENAGILIAVAVGVAVLTFVFGVSFARSAQALQAQRAEDNKLFTAEGDRVDAACRAFLHERGVEMSADEMDEFIPVDTPSEEGLVSISQGVLGGNVVKLALYYRDGELVLTGTDGQELRPLVAA
jgi:hypothetical protein